MKTIGGVTKFYCQFFERTTKFQAFVMGGGRNTKSNFRGDAKLVMLGAKAEGSTKF